MSSIIIYYQNVPWNDCVYVPVEHSRDLFTYVLSIWYIGSHIGFIDPISIK